MKQFNVEIFDRNFDLVDHTNVSNPKYSVDYLSPVSNTITVFNCEANKGDYIRIKKGEDEFFGVIDAVTIQSEKTVNISYGTFLSLFDTDVLFDTDLQGTSTLEAVMADLIEGLFVNNTDTSMNIPGLTVTTQGSTSGWGFNLKSDTQNQHHCITNLYNTFIVRALEKYSVVLTVTPDFQAKTISVVIGKLTDDVQKIEADLQNVVEKNVVIKETNKDTNKLVVYNTADYTTTRTYYRHSDDTYSTTNTDRITPVIQEIHGVSAESNGTTTRTFAQVADSDAANLFGSIEYNNLIELIVTNEDSLVKPHEMKIGQIVNIISKGNQYTSILTGKTVEEKTQLTFGTIRIDLTKIIKRRLV